MILSAVTVHKLVEALLSQYYCDKKDFLAVNVYKQDIIVYNNNDLKLAVNVYKLVSMHCSELTMLLLQLILFCKYTVRGEGSGRHARTRLCYPNIPLV